MQMTPIGTSLIDRQQTFPGQVVREGASSPNLLQILCGTLQTFSLRSAKHAYEAGEISFVVEGMRMRTDGIPTAFLPPSLWHAHKGT